MEKLAFERINKRKKKNNRVYIQILRDLDSGKMRGFLLIITIFQKHYSKKFLVIFCDSGWERGGMEDRIRNDHFEEWEISQIGRLRNATLFLDHWTRHKYTSTLRAWVLLGLNLVCCQSGVLGV